MRIRVGKDLTIRELVALVQRMVVFGGEVV